MIQPAEKSAGTPTCTQPALEGQQSPDTLAEAPQAAPVKDSWAVWTAWSQNESLQEHPRRSGCSGGDLHKVLLIVFPLVQSQCSIQLCHSQQCQVSQRPGGYLNHLVAQVTALPVSCCQCLQL